MLKTLQATRQYEALWTDPRTTATTLLSLVLDEYGTEALEWDPHTVESEIRSDFRVDPPAVLIDKINTAITGLTTDAYYQDWLAFQHAANVLSGARLMPDAIDPVTPEEAAWAVTEMALWEDPKDTPRFSPEVRRFLGKVCEDNGLILPPAILSMADLGDAEARATATLAGDPTMYQGWWASQKDFANDVQDYVNQRLQQMIHELSQAPLEGRDDATWSRFTRKVNKKIEPVGSPARPAATL